MIYLGSLQLPVGEVGLIVCLTISVVKTEVNYRELGMGVTPY